MSAYMQMGHQTENLVGESHLDFDGIILSPLNRAAHKIESDCNKFKKLDISDIIFDAQLYAPKSNRKNITKYPYFPNDFESADSNSSNWWNTINENLHQFVIDKNIDAVTSPAINPKSFDNNYYMRSIESAKSLYDLLNKSGSNIRVIQTFLFDDTKLSSEDCVYELASTITSTPCEEIYLVYTNDIDPRLELSDSSIILSIMKLVYLIEQAGKKAIIAFCSTDILLYKAAGASSVATGKYFNLRRFSPKRFDEPTETGGGGPAAYLVSENLLALIRQADIERILAEGLGDILTTANSHNEWAETIFEHIESTPDVAWLKYSWRQYLSWFADIELRLETMPKGDIFNMCKRADSCWSDLDASAIFLVERKNKGEWIRAWLQAISDFIKWEKLITL